MALTKKDVEYVARLARLFLTDQEKENFAPQLETILEHVEKLKELDTSNVLPTAHPFFSQTVWREDQPIPWGNNKMILNNAPEREESFFKVKKVIE